MESTGGEDSGLEASLYGPGVISAWNLALVCAIVTWIFHPTKKFSRLSLSADVVIYALYACIAGAHMILLVKRFEPDEMLAVQEFLWRHRNHTMGNGETLSPALQLKIEVLHASFTVGVVFLVVSASCLIAILTVRDPDGRPKRWRPLPWVLFVSGVWVAGCFGFLATQFGLEVVLEGIVLIALFALTVAFEMALIIYADVFIASIPFVSLALAAEFWPGVRDEVLQYRRTKDTRGHIHVILWSFSGLVLWALLLLGVAYCIWGSCKASLEMFTLLHPSVGVRISAFDQLLCLGTGIVTLLFTVYTACGERIWGYVPDHLQEIIQRLMSWAREEFRWRSKLEKLLRWMRDDRVQNDKVTNLPVLVTAPSIMTLSQMIWKRTDWPMENGILTPGLNMLMSRICG